MEPKLVLDNAIMAVMTLAGQITKMALKAGGTYTCARQCNNGRDDPGWKDNYNGTWKFENNRVGITPRPNDFKSDFNLGERNGQPILTFKIEHIGYSPCPQTELVLVKRN